VPVGEPGNPVRLAEGVRAWDMAYEPTRQELYVATRDPRVQVFDARSGERGSDIDLPGWHGLGLEAIPGRVFLGVGGKDGLYAIDAATHTVAPWPVTGRIVTPVYLDADPDGKYLFLTYSRDIVAIDVERAAVIGRVVTPFSGAIAYDPGTRLLVVTYDDDPPPTRIVAYRVDENGLTPAGWMKSPSLGRMGVEPMHRGFLQSGLHTFFVWKAN
jgi:DNA-binding beta-propeller fold protein YncE